MLVWYASYGSNLSRDRFACYIAGGRPPGATRTYPGCRDPTMPVEERAMTLPGELFFGWESATWGGGVAFYDPDESGTVLARAYLITAEQLADVAAQEMHREPGEDFDLDEVLTVRRHALGPGRYETLHLVGELDAHPVLTFSADDPASLARNAPVAAYLTMMLAGLAQSHGLGAAEAADYLAARPGAAPWTPATIAALAPAGE